MGDTIYSLSVPLYWQFHTKKTWFYLISAEVRYSALDAYASEYIFVFEYI